MASSKDTFESKTFAANTFACGALRGLGVDVVVVFNGKEFSVTDRVGSFAVADRRGEFIVSDRDGGFIVGDN